MLKEKITSLVKKEDKPGKKKIENLIFIIILLITTLLFMKNIFKSSKLNTNSSSTNSIEIRQITKERDLEKEIESILSQIKGIDDVKVLITYSQTEKLVPLYNENSSTSSTEEKDNDGGERKIESIDINKEVVADSNQIPITEKVIYPKVEGAIIIAKGAQNIEVKDKIINAVGAVTGLPIHKIQVFEMKGD